MALAYLHAKDDDITVPSAAFMEAASAKLENDIFPSCGKKEVHIEVIGWAHSKQTE